MVEMSDSFNSTDKVGEVMRRLKVESSDDNDGVGDESDAYPDRPGEPDCIYYLRTGTCGYGSNCRFNHPANGHDYDVIDTRELPERAGRPDCGYYLKTGTCKYGSTCKYHHPKNKQVDSLVFPNILGLPMRQDAKPCHYYMQTGLCKYGYACKYHHPQPTSIANVLPAVGPVYGSGTAAVVPSSDPQSVDELSKASMYFSSSMLPLAQSYMPLVLSPSQGWNTYMGNVSPFSMTSFLAAPPSNEQFSLSNLPERPDQPECRYFMNHGLCKYGPDCKYHHPREKISELTSTSLGPLGLPLRPGQPLCSHYTMYGLCKYGPTCRFDHPMDGYSYAYSFGIPPLATPYSCSPLYNISSPYVPTSETSPSKPSNVSDWIKNGESASSNNLHSSTKSLGDSPEIPDSLPTHTNPCDQYTLESDEPVYSHSQIQNHCH